MIKFAEGRYIENDGWIGLDNRFWLKIIRFKRLFKKTKFKIGLISTKDEFDTQEKAIDFAKHILWCYAHMIKDK